MMNKVELVKWIDKVRPGEVVVRRFKGVLESETETTVSFKYNKHIVTLNKNECVMFNRI